MLVLCACCYKDVVPRETIDAIRAGLVNANIEFTEVADLCEAAEQRDPAILRAVMAGGQVVACYPRAVRWLLQWAGIDSANVTVHNQRANTAGEILAAVGGEAVDDCPSLSHERGGWVPWFPVIDYDRCVNCKQCLAFCPFGVYELSEDRTVVVKNPRSCKDNCPACARMCPQAAIIFPKVTESPIEGAPVAAEDLATRRENLIEEESKRGGNIHDLLARRRERASQRRFARPEAPRGMMETRQHDAHSCRSSTDDGNDASAFPELCLQNGLEGNARNPTVREAPEGR